MTQLSKFILAAQKLGFVGYEKRNGVSISMEQHQEALLKIFHLAGYFNLSNIWNDLHGIGSIADVEKVFDEISSVVRYSHADQPDPRNFDATYMRTNLFRSDNFDLHDALDLILYMAQHAFGRQNGQERYELVLPDWLTSNIDYFREITRLLGLIDRVYPTLSEYDGCWIAGASRIFLSQRIIDYNYYIHSQGIKIKGESLILAGEREIWANIDGMPPEIYERMLETFQKNDDIDRLDFSSFLNDKHSRVMEGKAYMINLAQSYNIKLNPSKPFIEYADQHECPEGRFPKRIYANYEDMNPTLILTETLISQDLLNTYSNHNTETITIIDTKAYKQDRPNTISTARDAAEQFIMCLLAGKYDKKKIFHILLCTNNPSIERQALAVQRQVDQTLEKYGLTEEDLQIKIEGVGFGCNQSLAVVHSEFGALITEKYKHAIADIEKTLGQRPKRDINRLLLQTRDKHIVIPSQPKRDID